VENILGKPQGEETGKGGQINKEVLRAFVSRSEGGRNGLCECEKFKKRGNLKRGRGVGKRLARGGRNELGGRGRFFSPGKPPFLSSITDRRLKRRATQKIHEEKRQRKRGGCPGKKTGVIMGGGKRPEKRM